MLLTPSAGGHREWDTTVVAVSGNPELTDEELRTYQGRFNAPDGTVRDDPPAG
ncbi:hypothetical protein [Streptomyces sp. NPDC127084]|uniref:hypothetical protein n=1 Tax=Streptomyces sp. NPDC127084 TaxID=3347133 RepID=UPI0036470D2A